MLYKHDLYTSIITHLFNSKIIEYDISKANISILLNENLISIDDYNYYINLPKDIRNIQIGKLQRDNEYIKEGLNNGFIKYRKLFFENNNIKDNDVLSIKKDAIYIIDKKCHNLDYGNVKFKEKNIYNLYIRFNNKYEFYYFIDIINNIEKLDIKGIKYDKIKLHENGMIDFLKFIFSSLFIDNIETVINYICNFLDEYNNFKLPISYYRELNSDSLYLYKTNGIQYKSNNYIDGIPLNISYNRNILIDILKILSSDFLYRVK